MRSFLLAALAVMTLGMLDTSEARADWRDGFGANPVFRNSVDTARPYEKSSFKVDAAPYAATKSTKSGKSANVTKRSKTAQKSNSLVQKASLTSSSTWAGSFGGGTQSGIASYYWQPQRVASGGWFNPNAMTAAHKTLPFGTKVEVTNLNNGKSVTVTINDRGPYIKGRIIDLSSAAAGVIGMKGSGIARVQMAVIGR